MSISAVKIAQILSVVEILALFIGGSILASFMMNSSLMVLILVTISWLVVVFAESCAIQFASHCYLLFIGGFRLIALTGVSVVPIILAPYFSDDS